MARLKWYLDPSSTLKKTWQSWTPSETFFSGSAHMCLGCTRELSQRKASFEHLKHTRFGLENKNTHFGQYIQGKSNRVNSKS